MNYTLYTVEKQIFSSQWLLNLLFFAGSDGAAADIHVGRVLATRYELIYQHALFEHANCRRIFPRMT